jgi:hypothetical protein
VQEGVVGKGETDPGGGGELAGHEEFYRPKPAKSFFYPPSQSVTRLFGWLTLILSGVVALISAILSGQSRRSPWCGALALLGYLLLCLILPAALTALSLN